MAKMSTSMKTRGRGTKTPTTGRMAAKMRSGNRTRASDKNVTGEGIYSNCRFTHVAMSLIGCNVQVQVKNGNIYDGILITCSPKMDVVLEMAHKVADHGTTSAPSKDLIIEKVIFNLAEIVSISVTDVDMDYAVKDAFTDSGISKYNGQVAEKELQPWEGEGGDELVLEGDASNGWDPNEMFKTNREQFNVQSTYDDKLSQYTTVLDKSNAKEYRKREEEAHRLAQEIEKTDGYRQRTDLENGDGDEEDKFSAVVRTGSNSPQSIGNGTGNKWTTNRKQSSYHSPMKNANRYVIPHMRRSQGGRPHGDGPGRSSPVRTSGPPPHLQSHRLPPMMQQQQQLLPPQQQQQPPPPLPQPIQQNQNSPHLQPPSQPPSQPLAVQTTPPIASPHGLQSQVLTPPQTPPAKPPSDTQNTVEKEDRTTESPSNASPDDSNNLPNTESKTAQSENSPKASKSEGRPHGPGSSRDPVITELKEFGHTFKLLDGTKADAKAKQEESERQGGQPEKADVEQESKDKLAETVKKSTLNPNAKEFVFNPNAKSFQPKHSNANTPTPPRPQTQSPIIHHPHIGSMGPGQPIPISYLPVMGAPVGQASQQKFPKRAVVSVQQRPDFNAAAQAATGQPLLAQTTGLGPHQLVQYVMPNVIPHGHGGMPQPTHSSYPQMMPVANPGTPRMMTPPNVSMVPNNQHGSQDPNQPQPAFFGHILPGAGAVPAHLSNHPGQQPQPHLHSHPHPAPAHINPHPSANHHSQHQQVGGQMGHQSGPTHHPSPSPVQHHGGPAIQQSHPPNSGTPQPHIIYANPGMGQQGHPPLQASPHNPTSPSGMHHISMSYNFNHPPHGPVMQGGPPMSLTQQTHPHSSGPHTMHTHSPAAGPAHHMMMMHPQAHGQMQGHGPQMQHGHQFPGHHMPAHMGGQGPGPQLLQQPGMGVIPVSQSSVTTPMPFLQNLPHHQVPNQGVPPVQSYPHNQ